MVEVCINNAFLLMRHQQIYQKTKKRFMRELSAGQTHRNEVSKSKIYAQTKHAFIRYKLPHNYKCYRYELYKTIKSIKMLYARTSKISVKLLPFTYNSLFIPVSKAKGIKQLVPRLRCKICRQNEDNN
ncbi:hypothetical protein T02_6772 [Trichinella nativa]|uniref:Uncharacterized protein n=1 Tax=Trichinella nativa TaxID=6335 RepID=A0A0V1LIQ6_9BILA|nr:hypothetical protein T02_6772 [Trichinella nativa]